MPVFIVHFMGICRYVKYRVTAENIEEAGKIAKEVFLKYDIGQRYLVESSTMIVEEDIYA